MTGLSVAWAGLGCLACGSTSHTSNGSNGTSGSGAEAAAGVAGQPAAASGGSATGGELGAPQVCPEAPQLQRANGTPLQLAFAPTLAGKPFVVGEPNTTAGGQVSPLNLRFYVSELSLVAADGSLLAVDLVSAAGKAEPYGIHLVNFEEPESTSVHVLAPPGTYAGAKFTLGINDACNGGGSGRGAPLSANSQMVWPHVAGFLFLRYEATWTPASGEAASASPPPNVIHMGGLVGSIFAPQASVAGTLTIPATGTVSRTIQVSFEEIFRGASSAEDVSNLPLPFQTSESIAGERLRRAVPTLGVFKLAEP